MAFGQNDEVVSTGFGQNDEVLSTPNVNKTFDSEYDRYSNEYDLQWTKPQIPETIQPKKLSRDEWEKRRNSDYIDRVVGLVEAPLSLAAKLPAQLAGGPAALYAYARGKRGKELEDIVGQITAGPEWTNPRTDTGQRLSQDIAEILQPFGLSPYANIGAVGARGAAIRRPSLKRDIPEKPAATIPDAVKETQPEVDLGQQLAEARYRDDATVARLEAALAKRNEPQPTMSVDVEGRVFTGDDIKARDELASVQKMEEAQQSIEARQAALEAEMAQRATLERQAAERARMEQQPTGYAEWQEAQRQAANERIPGNNEGLPFESPYPVDASQYPNVMRDAPYRYEGGIDATDFVAGQKGLPIEVRDALGDTTSPDPFNRYSPKQAARRILEEGEHPPIVRGFSGNQRGVINVKAISDTLNEIKAGIKRKSDLYTAFDGAFNPYTMKVAREESMDPKSRERLVWMSPDDFHKAALRREDWFKNSTGADTRRDSVREGLKFSKDGLHELPYLWVDDAVVMGHEGRHRMDVFKELGVPLVPVRLRDVAHRNEAGPLSEKHPKLVSENGEVIPTPKEIFELPKAWIRNSERGAIDFESLSEGFKKLAGLTKDSPEVVKAQKQAVVREILPGLGGYIADITTPEQVIAKAPQAKDLTRTQKFNADTWRPGLRLNTIGSNNPLLKYANHVIHKAWTEAENLSRIFITDDKTGIGPVWKTLSPQERIEVHELLKAGDRKQRRYTLDELRANNFSEKQVNFIDRFYKMDDKKYEVWNDFRMQTGQDPIKYREGHFPGNFKGDYRAMVLDKEGNFIGYIGTDTRIGFESAAGKVKEQFPDATITKMTRKQLGGYSNRSDMFSGLRDVLQLMAKEDPRIAQIMEIVDARVATKADATFGANLHALDKKGIWGNEGNKPWKTDKLSEANDAMRSFFEYWEEGMISHHMLPVEANLMAVMRNPALEHMPRAMDYVNSYVKGMTGRHVGQVGSALNTLIDIPFKLTGLGPSVPRQAVNQFTKRMGQLTQGFMNIPYTAMQFTQIAQTGMPLFTKVYGEVSKSIDNPKSIIDATTLATKDGMQLFQKRVFDKADGISDMQNAMFDYAEQRGMLQFSEFEEVSQIGQNKFAQRFDQAVDANRTVGEKATRPFTFFTFVRLLEDSGMPREQIFDTAYNLTQDAMVDYSARERAPMFKNLGVVGQTAGNLQQFSLTYLDQIGRWFKDAKKGDAAPLLVGLTTLLTFAGIQGVPFYSTADELVQFITNKFFDEKKNINTLVMQNAGEWMKSDLLQYGLLSDLSGWNVSSRLGMADALPESLLDAVSPYAGTAQRMGESVYDAATNQDSLSFAQMARQFAPSSVRGLVENHLLTTPDGYTINKQGQFDYQRDAKDRIARKIGFTSLEESKAKEKLYAKSQSVKADTERVTTLGNRISRRFAFTPGYFESPDWQKDLAEYVARGGDANQLVNKIINDEQQRKLTSKQRAEGVEPKNIQQLRRWLKINEE